MLTEPDDVAAVHDAMTPDEQLGLGAVFAVHLAMQVAFYELYPLSEPEKMRGPFELGNYVRPMLLFIALPSLALGAIDHHQIGATAGTQGGDQIGTDEAGTAGNHDHGSAWHQDEAGGPPKARPL